MDIKHINFRDHIASFILIVLILLISIFSYYRFFIINDYIIKYEAECDFTTKNCFIGCEDDACTQQYYYFYIQKHADDLYQQCGEDITNCETSNFCLPSDRECSINYCNTEADGNLCEMITEEIETQDSYKNEPLQNNEIIIN